MPKFGTFYARIKIDAKELPEYDVQIDENEKKVSCWIPSEVGKNFSVCWSSAELEIDIDGKVKLDGVYSGGKIASKGLKIDANHSSFYTSSTTRCDFSFSPITYTDDDTYLNVPTPNFGEIELEIRHIKLQGESMCHRQDPFASPTGKIHERSKKLGTHRVQFGTLQQVPEIRFRNYTMIKRLATFVFRYRPLDMLQANGIAPPPSRALSDQQTRDNNKRKSLEQDEIEIKEDHEEDDIDRRMVKLKEELRQLEDRRAKKRVKVEKRDHSLILNEVIDLT